jgi:hypothetical protein
VIGILAELPAGDEPLEALDLVALALAGDWEFRGIRPPARN